MSEPLATARAWLDAAIVRDEAVLLALSGEDIRLYNLKGRGKGPGPAGLASGHKGLRKWFEHTVLAGPVTAAHVDGARVLLLHGSAAAVLTVAGGRVTDYVNAEGPDPVRSQGFRGAPNLLERTA